MLTLLCSMSLVFELVGAGPAEPTVYDLLTQQGLRLQTGETVRLPLPTMPDGLDGKQQLEILRKVAGKYPFDRFLRNAVVAPFVMEIRSINDREQRRGGQRLDFYFVAYGDRKALLEEGMFSELVGAQETPTPGLELKMHTLTNDELAKRHLTVRNLGDAIESYVAVDVPILERVQLSGVGRGVKQRSSESLSGAWMLDERFIDDPEYPNRWKPILRDEAGRMSLGKPNPYSGLGGYIKITWLHEPAGAILVECHAAFDEPYEWFQGKNLLRSKLPLAVQENVRTFRRKLAKLSAE